MSITVKSIDVYGIEARLRLEGNKDVLNYIRALKEALGRQQDVTAKAIKRLRELTPSEKGWQPSVDDWVNACFGAKIAKDVTERNHRFVEEALELVQTTGCTGQECHQLVDYVFDRPVGETAQEVGGVMTTLAALCNAIDQNMYDCAYLELERVWDKVEQIRAKQAAKPKHSPLPQ